jgi:hypothetical protein
MALEFRADTHEYFLDGKKLPSVTGILERVGVLKERNGVEYWDTISPRFNKNQIAAMFGSAFHEIARCRVAGIECEYDPQIQPWVDQLDSFLLTIKHIEPIFVEKPLGSARLGYAGTPDFFGMDDKCRYYLLDWKTAESFSKSFALQLAAYAELIKEDQNLRSNTKFHMRTIRFFRDKWVPDDCNDPRAAMQFRSILNTYKLAA